MVGDDDKATYDKVISEGTLVYDHDTVEKWAYNGAFYIARFDHRGVLWKFEKESQ